MAANQNKILSGGIPDGLIKRVTTARTSVATIASPSDAADLRLLFTAGTNGGFINELGFQFVGTGTQLATIVYFWVTDTSGANAELIPGMSIAVPAMALMSTSVLGSSQRVTPTFLDLAAGRKVFMTVSILSASCECVGAALGGQYEAQ